MKKNETITLNGKDYTLELNRESYIQIDRLCNVQKSMDIIYKDMYTYYDDIDISDDFDPSVLNVSDDELDKKIEQKEQRLEKMMTSAYFIWLYPNHHLKISEVKAIIDPYLKDEEKSKWLGEQTGKFLGECIEIRDKTNQERKNLQAQVNKNKK